MIKSRINSLCSQLPLLMEDAVYAVLFSVKACHMINICLFQVKRGSLQAESIPEICFVRTSAFKNILICCQDLEIGKLPYHNEISPHTH